MSAATVRSSKSGAPYLAVSLTHNPGLLAGLASDLPDAAKESRRDTGLSSDAVNAELLDAWVRMLRLMRPHLIFLH
ncbi:AraC family transcriptional regulator N-terminal domain-containing protein [Pseudomonas typographi]|uniref:AraC family transcriptional regulator N-terminal domain-containing protein n=1 Tax=Pseudomonas typographi TaxID=2715964 RepID=UPI001EEEE83E|nr:AraC family transcriptional regulator N-terminal domain-containing protein [Pseudomonas typographi]